MRTESVSELPVRLLLTHESAGNREKTALRKYSYRSRNLANPEKNQRSVRWGEQAKHHQLDKLACENLRVFTEIDIHRVSKDKVRHPPHVVQQRPNHEVQEPNPVILRRRCRQKVLLDGFVPVFDLHSLAVLAEQRFRAGLGSWFRGWRLRSPV